jgi:hypothetical protein
MLHRMLIPLTGVRRIPSAHPALWSPMLVAAVLVVATGIKLWLALNTLGTNDVLTWQRFVRALHAVGGSGVYATFSHMNHPPFMLHVLSGLDALAGLSGITFPFWLRLPAILADIITVILMWQLLRPYLAPMAHTASIALLAAAPPSILISGFHGNTDPLMIMFVVLTVWLLTTSRPIWVAAVAFGGALSIKVVPIFLIPVFVFYIPRMRQRTLFGIIAGATWLVAGLPYVLQSPALIASQVFGYGSLYGDWGWSLLLRMLGTASPAAATLYVLGGIWGKYVMAAVLMLQAWWFSRVGVALAKQVGLALLAVLVLTPGFGVQYLSWAVPWVVLFGLIPTILTYSASGVLLGVLYNAWSQGSWWLAVSTGVWPLDYWLPGLLCWATLLTIWLVTVRHTPGKLTPGAGTASGVLAVTPPASDSSGVPASSAKV